MDVIDVRSTRAKEIVAKHLADVGKRDPAQTNRDLIEKIESIIGGPDPLGARPLLEYVRTTRFTPASDPTTVLSGEEQSVLILGMLMALDIDAGLHQAVHFYMALIRGTRPEKLAHLIRVAQIYVGLSGYTASMRTLSETLAVLEETDPSIGPAAVLGKIVEHYGHVY